MKNKDMNLLISIIEDKINMANDNCFITNTNFLTMAEQSSIETAKIYNKNIKSFFYGGYKEAERKVLINSPTIISESIEEIINMQDILKVFRIFVPKGSKALNHRDYLGSILALGINRNKIGDILVNENGADIIIFESIAEFLNENYTKVGRVNITNEILDITSLNETSQQFEVTKHSVASLRLDNIVSKAINISRTQANDCISSKIVFVNGIIYTKPHYMVLEGSTIVVKGYGKFIFNEIKGKSKKDRYWIEIKKYT